jgi:hypothetical protein
MRLRWAAPTALCAALLAFSGCGSTSLNPTPTISTLYPDTLPASGANCGSLPTFVINAQGTNFIATSVAYWNGSSRTTVFNTETGQLAVTLKACDIAAPGVAYVTVSNPAPGGGLTLNAASFQVTQPPNPAPQIMSLSPASTPAGTLPPNGILTINGPPTAAGSISPAFISTSVAAFNGSARATTFVSATELQVQMLASDVATAGTINVTISTPIPGGGVANAQFTVTDPPNAANFPQVISVNAAGGAANGPSSSPAMSADGRYVAFVSTATNLVPVGKLGQVFIRDTCVGASNCYPTTYPVDVTPQQGAPNGSSFGNVSISDDARFVAFASYATNLVSAEPKDSRGFSNVFVRDTCLGGGAPRTCVPSTTEISVDALGNPGSLASDSPSINGDGRFVAFRSSARDLVSDGSASGDIFVRDTCEGTAVPATCVPRTVKVSADVLFDGEAVTFPWSRPAISSQGRYVVFDSTASTDSVTNGFGQIFISDTCLGASTPADCVPRTTLVTVPNLPESAYTDSQSATVSEDGRFVAFKADKLFSDTSVAPLGGQVFIHDTCLGSSAPAGCTPSTALVTADSEGSPANAKCLSPRISPSGRFVSFTSSATNLDSGVTGPSPRAFVRDTCFGDVAACTPRTVAIAPSESQTIGTGWLVVPVTSDGRYAAFYSIRAASSLPSSGLGDVFLTVTPFQHQ